jgi:hypothetical protein
MTALRVVEDSGIYAERIAIEAALGEELLQALDRALATGDEADRDAADTARLFLEFAVAGRPHAYVDRLERERGLSGAEPRR